MFQCISNAKFGQVQKNSVEFVLEIGPVVIIVFELNLFFLVLRADQFKPKMFIFLPSAPPFHLKACTAATACSCLSKIPTSE
jgi:hypothetical protein